MPYKLSDFKAKGLYIEKPGAAETDTSGGHVIPMSKVPEKARKLLTSVGGTSHGGDLSKQDSAAITGMLAAGIPAPDVFATFAKSPRGRDAEERKPGHFEDYLQRTIEKASGYITRDHIGGNGNGNGKLSVDFAKRRVDSIGSGIVTRRVADIEIEKVGWVWPKYIPAGKLTILAGDPSMGKSTMAIDLVSRITRGAVMPCGNRGVTGSCLIASAEDSAADTLAPRLKASGAIASKVHILDHVKMEGEDETRPLSLPLDLVLLRTCIENMGARLMIIDPLDSFLGGEVDTHKNADIRRTLHPLEKMAEETGAAILVLAHLRKSGSEENGLYRVSGSIGFTAAARSVLGVTEIDKKRILYPMKNNLSKRPDAFHYEVVSHYLEDDKIGTSKIQWLGVIEFDPNTKTTAVSSDPSTKAAAEWLKSLMSEKDEPMSSEFIFKQAKLAGVNKTHMMKAKDDLGITAIRQANDWVWVFPS